MRLAGGMLALVFAQASGALVRGGGEPQRDFVLRAGALHPGDGEVRRDVAIVVRGGRIEGVLPEGAALPSELPVVDRRDAFVTPGLVVADAGTGLTDVVFEERARGFAFGTYHVFRTVDPLREAIDGFSFEAPRTSLLAAGVTTVYLSPGLDRLVNGRGAVVKTAGSGRESRTLRATADLAISIGDDPQDPPDFVDPPLPPSAEHPLTAPKRQMPRTRASAPYALRLAFENAIEHAKAVRAARAPGERPPLDPELSALAAALKARAAVRIRTSGESDVPAALSLLRDYELPGALVGCARAEAHAKAIAEAGVPAIVELSAPSGRSPANVPARANDDRPRPRTAAELAAAGVRIAIVPADDTPTDEFPLVLARAVAGGLAPGSAVRAATYEPARILGVEDRVGSIAPGRDADFVVWNGEPGSASTSVRETWVAGVRAFDRTEGERRRRDAQREVAPLGSVVVRAGLVLPMAGEPIRDGAVSVYDGRIIGVGRDVPVPPGVRVIDAGRDAVITPGLIDARSFLGLDGDSGAVTGSVPLEHLAVPREPDFRRVAEGGVTTVLVQGVGFASSGTPVAALKTGGSTSQAVVREVCGVGIPSMGSAREAYRNLLVRGKQYSERWDKYFADVDRQRDEERRAAAEGKKPESAPAEAAPAPSRAEEDPLSGTWEGTLHGGPLPRPVTFTLKLVLKNGSVSGTFSGRGPLAPSEPVEFDNGTFHNGTLRIEVARPELPAPAVIEARIDRPDHLTGSLDARVIRLELEATRTEKTAPTLRTAPRKKKGPEMPAVDDNLEPFRRLFHGDATVVAVADRKEDIEAVVAVVVDELHLPLALLGGAEAAELAPTLAAKGVGFVAGPAFPKPASGTGLPIASRLALAGAPLALGSASGTGGRDLREVGAFAVSRGLGGDQVLRAATLGAASMFRIDGRVGSLAPGKDGDLVAWSSSPLDGRARPLVVIVGGEVVSEETR